MHKAKQSINFNIGGAQVALVEGELIDLDAFDPGVIEFIEKGGYAERAKGKKADLETPESKTAGKTETRIDDDDDDPVMTTQSLKGTAHTHSASVAGDSKGAAKTLGDGKKG